MYQRPINKNLTKRHYTIRTGALRFEPEPILQAAHRLLIEKKDLNDQLNARLNERNELLSRLNSVRESPFIHYNAIIEPQGIISRHAAPDLKPHDGYLTNYLGVLIDPKFFPTILEERAGQIDPIPIPANWHADIAEWGAALRAVDLATHTFTVMELGCGWGCWLNNTGVAARRAGLDVHLVGVEGDSGHAAFALQCCADNGFQTDQVTIHRGIAAPQPGIALFPRQQHAGAHWGLQPVFGATDDQHQSAIDSGNFDAVPMLALADLLAPHDRVDLLHVDIQGGEADLVDGCTASLSEKVAYMVIGTHSRQIEGRIMDTLSSLGWILEIERPAIYGAVDAQGPLLTVDGVQGWRNPVLRPV